MQCLRSAHGLRRRVQQTAQAEPHHLRPQAARTVSEAAHGDEACCSRSAVGGTPATDQEGAGVDDWIHTDGLVLTCSYVTAQEGDDIGLDVGIDLTLAEGTTVNWTELADDLLESLVSAFGVSDGRYGLGSKQATPSRSLNSPIPRSTYCGASPVREERQPIGIHAVLAVVQSKRCRLFLVAPISTLPRTCKQYPPCVRTPP